MSAQVAFDTRLEYQRCTLLNRRKLTCGETAALALNPQPVDYNKQPSLRPTRSGLAEWFSRVQQVVDRGRRVSEGIDMRKLALLMTVGAMLAGSVISSAIAQETIKIGVNEPLTGAFAASGNYVTNGAKIAADEINAKGGVLGKKIELVIEDNKSNPTEAASVAEKLMVRDKVPVMMGAWGSSLTLAVMPKLMEYKVPMLVETSSSGKITTSGNPYIFRISPPSAVEAVAFAKIVDKLHIKKADFLVINNDWGLGTAQDFGKMFKEHGIDVGLVERMDQSAQDMSAQLAKFKASDADTLIVTSAVEQLTLVFKQAAALGLKKQIITTGGSQNPDQLIDQAGTAVNGTLHLTTFAPWVPEASPDPQATKGFIAEWKKRGFQFAGVTESFRGYDGIRTIAAAIQKAGKADPEAIRAAFWQLDITGLNGKIKFIKSGPDGKESGQSIPTVYLIKIENGKVIIPKV
jgi:branched-chain amino acid transport system substrate-binding protein